VEFLELAVTPGIYLFDGYRLSFFQVDSQNDIRPMGRYRRLVPFFEKILQVVIF